MSAGGSGGSSGSGKETSALDILEKFYEEFPKTKLSTFKSGILHWMIEDLKYKVKDLKFREENLLGPRTIQSDIVYIRKLIKNTMDTCRINPSDRNEFRYNVLTRLLTFLDTNFPHLVGRPEVGGGVTGGGNSASAPPNNEINLSINEVTGDNVVTGGAGIGGRNSASALSAYAGGETIAVRTLGAPSTAATAAPAATATTAALTPARTEIEKLEDKINELQILIQTTPLYLEETHRRLLEELNEKGKKLCELSKSSSICSLQGGRRYRKKTKMTKRKRQNRKKQRLSRRK